MCGIVGYVGPRGRERDPHGRGSASSSIGATTRRGSPPSPTTFIEVRRCVGKLDNWRRSCGAAARRHARHRPHALGDARPASEQNAHPHRAGKVVVIHNGIIENYLELRAALERRGRKMLGRPTPRSSRI